MVYKIFPDTILLVRSCLYHFSLNTLCLWSPSSSFMCYSMSFIRVIKFLWIACGWCHPWVTRSVSCISLLVWFISNMEYFECNRVSVFSSMIWILYFYPLTLSLYVSYSILKSFQFLHSWKMVLFPIYCFNYLSFTSFLFRN